MPLYDYHCELCGDFRELRPMRESREPVGCPTCGAPSARVLSTPFLAGGDSGAGAGARVAPAGGSPFGGRHACCGHAHGCSH
jgi:putative FmdB family regulatory protein